MTHTEHLLKLIAEGEQLRDQMRREMEVMAEIIQRQNETAIKQGRMLNVAEGKIYKLSGLNEDKVKQLGQINGRQKSTIKELNATIFKLSKYIELIEADKSAMKAYIKNINNGEWPEELK